MAYLGDIRENSISPEGIIWESDNRKDARYYWNGAFIDLCDLPGEDYAKTIFVTSGSASDIEPTKTVNTITIELVQVANNDGVLVYAYKATAKKPVASDVDIMITVEDMSGSKETVTFIIKNGESATAPVLTSIVVEVNVEEPKIVTSNYKKEDDEFKYTLVLPAEKPVLPMAYRLTLKKGDIDTISNEELVAKLLANGEIVMKDNTMSEKFDIELPYIPIDGLQQLSFVEQKQALLDNSQDFIIVTDKEIVNIEQVGSAINEINAWVKRNETVSINGKIFLVWYKRDDSNTSQSRICDSENADYKLGVAKDIEYIIYYN